MIGDVARGRSLQILYRDLSALFEGGAHVADRLARVEDELFLIEARLAEENLFLRPDGELVGIPEEVTA